ncbi:MAG TPA: hypothetical protein VLY23_15160 [Candidatus Acidoferrum sp.]|nr:hypothetical protein [Candidatus Acidoferrum sp.]
MKIKLSWIVLGLTLIAVAGIVIPRIKYWMPSSPSASEPARPEQSSPEATVNAVFQMTDQGDVGDNPKEALDDRLNDAHLLEGKNMTPDEARFAGLFWDNQRSAAVYDYVRAQLTKSATITGSTPNGDSATVNVSVQIFPDNSQDWVASTCTIELKRRGPNWYVDELKSQRFPNGVYAAFKQRVGALGSVR